MPYELPQFIKEILSLPNLIIIGVGCILACYGWIKPDDKNMRELSEIVVLLEKEFQIDLEIISGRNSANYECFKSSQEVGRD